MGGSELGCCAQVIRVLLIIINILFGALGIVVFAIGIWAIVENRNFDFVTGNEIASGAALLIAAGLITMIICVCGILGAIFKLRPILVIFAGVVFIIVVLEIVGGILAFVFRDNVTDELRDESLRALREYRASSPDNPAEDFNEDVNDFVAFIQNSFDCCGVNNASDWFIENSAAVMEEGRFPECTVCDATADNCAVFFNASVVNRNLTAFSTGCLDATNDGLTVFFYAVGGLGIALGVFQIVGILFALFLCCCITSARKQEVV